MIGKISAAPEIKKVHRGKGNAHFCSVQFGENDIRQALYMPGAGVDAAPCQGDIVTCIYIGSDLFITGGQSAEPEAKSGEYHRYIRNKDGEIVAEFHFTVDGALGLNIKDADMKIKIGEKTTLSFTKDGTAELKVDKNKIEFGASSVKINGNLEILQ